MVKLIDKNLITEIKPAIRLGEGNRNAWEKLEKLAKEINRLNKRKISAVKILLKERKIRY
ncbi:hypothetical protein KJ636_03270 [Patescibacteria group bacterium]|nr:hypothetical protein [Patescibacteria group bacterium]MBU4481290.1 hypothetical protein [Patescibacteria group bacterium]